MNSSTQEKFKFIDAMNVQELLEKEKLYLIDVRETGEYAGEHIPGYKNLPLSKFQPQQVSLVAGKEIVTYCQSGRRSNQAAEKLVESGFTEFSQLQGGITAWKQSGYINKVNKNAPIQVQMVAGFLVFTGTILGAFVSLWFLILSGFVGAGLVFARVTNTCGMAVLLAKLPYNQPS